LETSIELPFAIVDGSLLLRENAPVKDLLHIDLTSNHVGVLARITSWNKFELKANGMNAGALWIELGCDSPKLDLTGLQGGQVQLRAMTEEQSSHPVREIDALFLHESNIDSTAEIGQFIKIGKFYASRLSVSGHATFAADVKDLNLSFASFGEF